MPRGNLNKRIKWLKGQLEEAKIKLPKAARGASYVDHEDALAERRYINYLVIRNQIESLKEAIKELEGLKSKG